MKKNIQDYKKEATLNKVMRFDGIIMTRRDWLRAKMIEGWKVEEKEVPAIQFNRAKYNRMDGFEQQAYDKRLAEKKIEYRLTTDKEDGREFYVITKTEYEYFNNMELAEDKATEAMELTYKIEAGTATDQEIEQDEQKELEFFHKYANK